MLEPLKQFFCDTCGTLINSPQEGMIEWVTEYNNTSHPNKSHSFHIIHHRIFSPNITTNQYGCHQNANKRLLYDSHLNDFINPDMVMGNILKFLDEGRYHQEVYQGPRLSREFADIREFVEVVRRITIPYYEEARFYLAEAISDGHIEGINETAIYHTELLKGVIQKYGYDNH